MIGIRVKYSERDLLINMKSVSSLLLVLCLGAASGASPRPYPKNGNAPETKTRKLDRGLDEYMYQTIVTLVYNQTNQLHHCKGTIIRPRLIMTAAYCLFGAQPTHVNISTKNEQQESSFEIQTQFSHPGYDLVTDAHNIAILLLKKPIPDSREVKLPNKAWDFTTGADVGSVYGWGETENGTFFNELRILALPIVSQKICQNHARTQGHFLCVDTKHAYICNGNTGGPLTWHYYQIGIATSLTAGSCKSGKPSAFTDVSAYEDWMAPYVRKYYD